MTYDPVFNAPFDDPFTEEGNIPISPAIPFEPKDPLSAFFDPLTKYRNAIKHKLGTTNLDPTLDPTLDTTQMNDEPTFKAMFGDYLDKLSSPNINQQREKLPNQLSETQLLAIETDCPLLWNIESLPLEQKIFILTIVRNNQRNNLLIGGNKRHAKNSKGIQRERWTLSSRQQRKDREQINTWQKTEFEW